MQLGQAQAACVCTLTPEYTHCLLVTGLGAGPAGQIYACRIPQRAPLGGLWARMTHTLQVEVTPPSCYLGNRLRWAGHLPKVTMS